jgi:hypothetical protein
MTKAAARRTAEHTNWSGTRMARLSTQDIARLLSDEPIDETEQLRIFDLMCTDEERALRRRIRKLIDERPVPE